MIEAIQKIVARVAELGRDALAELKKAADAEAAATREINAERAAPPLAAELVEEFNRRERLAKTSRVGAVVDQLVSEMTSQTALMQGPLLTAEERFVLAVSPGAQEAFVAALRKEATRPGARALAGRAERIARLEEEREAARSRHARLVEALEAEGLKVEPLAANAQRRAQAAAAEKRSAEFNLANAGGIRRGRVEPMA
jgi:hypothetical protein